MENPGEIRILAPMRDIVKILALLSIFVLSPKSSNLSPSRQNGRQVCCPDVIEILQEICLEKIPFLYCIKISCKMASTWDDSRIVTPYMPSLFQLASVSVAIILFNQFDIELMEEVFAEIQNKNPPTQWKGPMRRNRGKGQQEGTVGNDDEEAQKTTSPRRHRGKRRREGTGENGDERAQRKTTSRRHRRKRRLEGSEENSDEKAQMERVTRRHKGRQRREGTEEDGDEKAQRKTTTRNRREKRRREDKLENLKVNRAKESLLFIPDHLRKTVLESFRGLHYEIENWRTEHMDDINYKYTINLRPEGTVDRIETAYHMVLDKRINIRKRFEMACMYCLEKRIRTLWAEMEASGQTDIFETDDNTMVRFWVRWMREGSRVPWTQAAREYLDPPSSSKVPIPRFSAFLPLLRPEDRQRFLTSLRFATPDDLRFCLYALTKEEEEQILKLDVSGLLCLYLDWPLQRFFLETARKVWDYMDNDSFRNVLDNIIYKKYRRKKLDYSELFRGFWNSSPNHLRRRCERLPICD
ncbi:hypothetical protein AVEN_148267-1 [Araneus ventricosus]|uniref:Uncharacterized protein n=1 Tax=Araneus ventricosus TaxID=182803 RepID=A0A4Y2HKB6_ARAVE|nr:hypothetical protein AVEN_148267-1 [Araneus ventricosus]